MITPPNQGQPIVDAGGRMAQVFRAWTQSVSRLAVLSGTGSPEGVVNAPQNSFYVDEVGTPGSILYVKRDAGIGGDPTQGWVLV